LFDVSTTNNSVRGNSIYSNSGFGIYLDGSANISAVAPALVSATLATSLSVTGGLSSIPSTTFHLDFYANPPPQYAAQAKTYLGAKDVTTGLGGSVNFVASLGAIVPVGWNITATATDPAGNTSALSSSVLVSAVDSVGDGIPNVWRASHFGGSGTTTNSQSCAACDPDHDGMSNWQEFLAGTDPTNAASVLRISTLTLTNSDVTISFQSVTGINYRLDVREDVETGGWSVLANGILGNGAVMRITDPGIMAVPRQFYRLSVDP
jgi:parallel beta-helix repeat protein